MRTGDHKRKLTRRVAIMELVLLLFFVVITVAAAFGWTADSRDSADWKPSDNGRRVGNYRARAS